MKTGQFLRYNYLISRWHCYKLLQAPCSSRVWMRLMPLHLQLLLLHDHNRQVIFIMVRVLLIKLAVQSIICIKYTSLVNSNPHHALNDLWAYPDCYFFQDINTNFSRIHDFTRRKLVRLALILTYADLPEGTFSRLSIFLNTQGSSQMT